MSIFAREITDDLASLVKQVDEQVGKNSTKEMKAFVVILAEDADAAAPKLEKLAKDQGIKNVPLTIFDGQNGPPEYNISEDADLTVMMWVDSSVKVNHALDQDKLDKDAVKAIVGDTSKILN